MQLVSGQREELDGSCTEIDRNFTDRLHRVGVKDRLLFSTYFRRLFDREKDARFVISPQQRNDCGVWPDGGLQLREVDHSFGVDIQPSHFITASSKRFGMFDNSTMLHLARNDVLAILINRQSRLQRGIV